MMAHNRPNEQFARSALDLFLDQQQAGGMPGPCPPKPLQIRKQEPSQQMFIEQTSTNRHGLEEFLRRPCFQPRRSSICDSNGQIPCESTLANSDRIHGNHINEDMLIRSTLSSNRSNPFSITSLGEYSNSVSQSATSSHNAHHISSSSSEIIGNFVPFDEEEIATSELSMEMDIPYRDAISKNGQRYRAVDPYEFESNSPYHPTPRQTTFSDFIDNTQSHFVSAQRSLHSKNAHSDAHIDLHPDVVNSLSEQQAKVNSRRLPRSESSPNITEGHDLRHQQKKPTTYGPGVDSEKLHQKPRGRASSFRSQNDYLTDEFHAERLVQDLRKPCSPTRSKAYREHNPQNLLRGRPRSPPKTLGEVVEADESDTVLDTPMMQSTKRSRSPMKKMFGENGWLGKSPSELDARNRAFRPQREKISLMGRIKNKFEELAEKADLSPASTHHRSNKEKQHKVSVLSVSIGPPEQARILMEVELMVVHSANVFLMLQFSQGRMAVDSIKKTVDGWRSKGRPVVIEFMYDQATQRELVAANQNNFRFYGERAGDEMRISSMLYNWRKVASLMAIRTFCDADTVILKLLFDIEQILEFLGAKDPILYRLQQIRVSVVEMVRISRQNKEGSANPECHSAPAHDPTASSSFPTDYSTKDLVIEESHGGTNAGPAR